MPVPLRLPRIPRYIRHMGLMMLPLPFLIAETRAQEMLDMSLEQLMGMEVTVKSASKTEQKAIDAPSAIYVISQEDIRRAGISSIPEALRMAPGLHVARINSTEWAVSARGLNGRFSRYLLILIDGRSVYSSMFSGVTWDEQNLVISDIDRIEVIRGPGATLWGSNAVNGVINIITRAPDTEEPASLTLRGGEGEKAYVSGTYSSEWGQLQQRISAQHSEQNGLYSPTLKQSEQDWQHSRVSWQALWEHGDDQVKLYADLSQVINHSIWPQIEAGNADFQLIDPREEKNQYSLQFHWHKRLSERDELDVRASNDRIKRNSDFWFWGTRNSDAEVLWTRSFDRGRFQWGGNYRWTFSEFTPGETLGGTISPEDDNIELYSSYAQLQYQLLESLELTAGAKYESHSETGDNWQPTLRAMWNLGSNQRLWAAASKAVSTPSRTITDTSRIDVITLAPDDIPADISNQLAGVGLAGLPLNVSVGNQGVDVNNTELTAFELGYRWQPSNTFNIDVALFRNEYDNLVSTIVEFPAVEFGSSGPYVNLPLQYSDEGVADSKGVEVSASWKVSDGWLLKYSGSYINFDPSLEIDNGITALERLLISEDTPTTQHSIRSRHTLTSTLSLEAWLYHYGEMKSSGVDDFTSANLRLEWQPDKHFRVALIGKNLIDSERVEFYREVFFTGIFETEATYNLELHWSFD